MAQRLSKKQGEVIQIIYDCLNHMTGMTPTNPAAIKCKLHYHDQINKASSRLMYAVSQFAYGELDSAKENALLAQEVLVAARNVPAHILANE